MVFVYHILHKTNHAAASQAWKMDFKSCDRSLESSSCGGHLVQASPREKGCPQPVSNVKTEIYY